MNDHRQNTSDAGKDIPGVKRKKLKISGFSALGSFPLISFFSGLFRKRNTGKDKTADFKTISAKALIASDERYCLIDLRSIDDFFKDHIVIDRKGISFNLPYESFPVRRKELQRFMTKKLLLYSDDDSKTIRAAMELSASGFDVTVLIGGYDSYKREMYQ